MNRRDFLKFASAAPFAGVAAESFVATGIGESCNYNVDVLVVGGGPAGVCAANSVDVHGGKDNPMVSSYTTINANWYGVSYRCLVAKGVDNLLLAGRCLSGEPAAAGAVRVMPPCMAMGQAAGTAAALCVKTGATPRALDASKLVATLREQKAFLG